MNFADFLTLSIFSAFVVSKKVIQGFSQKSAILENPPYLKMLNLRKMSPWLKMILKVQTINFSKKMLFILNV